MRVRGHTQFTNYVDKHGGGGFQMSMLQHKLRYVVNLSTEEGECQKSCLRSLCMTPYAMSEVKTTKNLS